MRSRVSSTRTWTGNWSRRSRRPFGVTWRRARPVASDWRTRNPSAGWFVGRPLAQAGFPLTGGRLDYVAGRPVAALVYTRGQHTINVFVWPEASDAVRSSDARAIRGFHVRHWTRAGMSYWAVSDVNDADLDQFVRALQP